MVHRQPKARRRTLRLVGVVVASAALVAGAMAAIGGAATKAKAPIRVGILSDCEGAFGAFHAQDVGGAIAAFAQFTGAKPKNPNNPIKGMKDGNIAGHPVKLVGIGCGNDRADRAIAETRRLMEQLKADVMIGPLSGDEGIAVANYAKAHPRKTIVNGTSGAQDTTLHVRAPNFSRFNGDGAQWDAGTGDVAIRKLGWKTAATIADDYSFGWTSMAGFIAEFCAEGGKVIKRVNAPLNTTDYSSYVAQLPAPNQVDGYFSTIGGSGTLPMLKAFEQRYGPINPKQWMGNLFFATPGTFRELGNRMNGVYAGGFGTAPDLKTKRAKWYVGVISKWWKKIPGTAGSPAEQAGSGFLYNYFNNAWGLIKGLKAVKGDLSDGQKKLQKAVRKVVLNSGYGKVRLDKNGQAIQDQYVSQLYLDKEGVLQIRTVAFVPGVDQTFGGTFNEKTKPPGRDQPPCKKRKLPWAGKLRPVVNGIVK